jgi:hypothetical protein
MPIAKVLKINGVIVDSCRTLGKMTKPSAERVLESRTDQKRIVSPFEARRPGRKRIGMQELLDEQRRNTKVGGLAIR